MRVRGLQGLNERLFAIYYPRVAALAENAGQRETRRELLAHASGATLELGAGTGINLPHFTDRVTDLVITEPSPHMLERLRAELAAHPRRTGDLRLVQCTAQDLPFTDESFDTVVATFLLCSTPDPERVLREIHRVLRPGGRYVFFEHVHAGEGTLLGRLQELVAVPHRYIAAGCHPNRRTEQTLQRSPLVIEQLEHGRQPRAPATVRPTIRGIAVKRREPGASNAA